MLFRLPLAHVVAALSALLFTACATQQGLEVRVMEPAAVDLGHYSSVALDRLGGDGAADMTAELAAALRAARNPLTGKADFEVLDRRDLDRMLDNVRSQRGTEVSADSMQMLERWKKADVMIRGTLQQHEVQTAVTAQEWVDQKTGEKHKTFTRNARANVGLALEIVTGGGEQIVDQQSLGGSAGAQTKAVDCQPAPIDELALLAQARGQVIGNFMERVLPHESTVWVVLETDGDLPELAAGNGFARTGDWAEAERTYRAAAERATGELAEQRWKAMHNLGVACTFQDRFDDARKALKEAYTLAQQESSLRMLQLANGREAATERLRQQDHSATPSR